MCIPPTWGTAAGRAPALRGIATGTQHEWESSSRAQWSERAVVLW